MTTRCSTGYLFTVETNDPNLAAFIADAKHKVKVHNAKRRVYEIENPEFVTFSWSGKQEVRRRVQVRVRGRLGKNNPNAHLYRLGGPLHRSTSQDIKLEHAARVDVYIQERRDYVPVK